MSYERIFPFFAAAFALLYLVAEQYNLALLTYHPRLGVWDFLAKPSRSGPAMYWYGWIATSLLGATALTAATYPLLRRWPPPVWIGWAVPLAVMATFAYIIGMVFLR